MNRARLLSLTVASLLAAASLSAATIHVTTTNPGIAQDGLCSLIEALENANDGAVHGDCTAGSSDVADIVELGSNQTYGLSSVYEDHSTFGPVGLPPISSELTIVGNGSNVQRSFGAGEFLLLAVNGSGDLTVIDLTLRYGDGESAGGLYNLRGRVLLLRARLADNVGEEGAGIKNKEGTTVLIDSEIVNNQANYWVGGIYNDHGTLRVINSTIAGNSSPTHGGGGVFSWCWNTDTTLIGSIVSNNSAVNHGGGIRMKGGGRIVIRGCEITGNSATDSGGGIAIDDGSTLEISDSLIAENNAVGGGGIFLETESQMAMTDCTIADNNATNGSILLVDSSQATVTNSTISDNPAGGVWLNLGGELEMVNTTVTANTGCGLCGPPLPSNATVAATIVDTCDAPGAAVQSNGWNMSMDEACGFEHQTDMLVSNMALSDLGDWGGAHQTRIPLAGSPAIDMGGDDCSRFDQRGYRRPVDGDGDGVAHCDCGAAEYGAAPPPEPHRPGPFSSADD
jgi:hypothetical protein